MRTKLLIATTAFVAFATPALADFYRSMLPLGCHIDTEGTA